LEVALQEGLGRHVVGYAVGQVGDYAVTGEVGLLTGDAQVATEIARDRGEHGLSSTLVEILFN